MMSIFMSKNMKAKHKAKMFSIYPAVLILNAFAKQKIM